MNPQTPETPPPGDAEEIARARDLFRRQRAHHPAVAATGPRERAAKLRRLAAEIEARRGAVEAALLADFRKPPAETELSELHLVLTEIRHAARHVGRWMRPRRVGTPALLAGTRSTVRPEPRGVALVLSPWNYPFNLALAPVVGAVAAGCCVVLRPSEKTPRTAAVIAEIVAASFPPEEVAVVRGGVPVAEVLLELPWDHVFFTGSARVGRRVMAAAAEHLASVTLELGGRSPAVVDRTADVARAARRIAWGRFLNAGQSCVAPNHVLVHAERERDLLDALAEAVREMYGATEAERRASPDLARIVDDAAWARLDGMIRDAVAAGARVEVGGETEAETRYVAPTVLSGVADGSPAMREEVFGPVLPVLAYRTEEEARARIRAQPRPLALYLFSEDRAWTERMIAGTSAGGTCVNDVALQFGNPELPFGGVGESGTGSYHGEHGFLAFSHLRAVVVQRWGLSDLLHPPFERTARRWLSRLMRRLERG